jgi:hypothetical protein
MFPTAVHTGLKTALLTYALTEWLKSTLTAWGLKIILGVSVVVVQ